MTDFPLFYSELSRDHKLLLIIRGLAFAKVKSSIQLLTLVNGADAIFKLKDEDWIKICDLKIEHRPLFEQVMKEGWKKFETLWDES